MSWCSESLAALSLLLSPAKEDGQFQGSCMPIVTATQSTLSCKPFPAFVHNQCLCFTAVLDAALCSTWSFVCLINTSCSHVCKVTGLATCLPWGDSGQHAPHCYSSLSIGCLQHQTGIALCLAPCTEARQRTEQSWDQSRLLFWMQPVQW